MMWRSTWATTRLSESCWAALCASSRSFLLARSCGSRLGHSRPSSGSSCCRERVRAIPASFLRNLSPFLPSTAGHQITTTQATIDQLRATSTVTVLDLWQGYGVMILWVVIRLAAAAVLLRRRDA